MGTLLPEIALLGVAVAFTSPGSVVTVIALLSMSSGRERALAFIVGWMLAIGLIAILTVELLQGQDFHSKRTSPSQAASSAEVVIGGLLLLLAARAYGRPQHKPKSQAPPKWLARIDRSHPLLGLLVGMVMLSYGLTLAAAAETLKAHVGPVDAALAGLLFGVTSIITIAAPVVIVLIAPERATSVLATSRNWVLAHSRSIALIALMVIGGALMAKGGYDLVA